MSRRIEDLDLRMQPLVLAFLRNCEAAGIDVLVTCTLRTAEEQTALYAIGRTLPGRKVTNAKAGQSAHQYGMAIDVVPLIHGKPLWKFPDPVWSQVGKIGQDAGLEWFGAPDSPYLEAAHLQIRNWTYLIKAKQS